MKNHSIILSAALATSLIATMSCNVALASSKFSCQKTGGVQCMSATQVYEATNTANHLENVSVKKSRGARFNTSEEAGIASSRSSLMLTTPIDTRPISEPSPTIVSDEPFRTPARVMRIWMSSWEDESGDLHMPGYVFTEIESRRWTVGERAPQTRATLTLITPQTQASSSDDENASATSP